MIENTLQITGKSFLQEPLEIDKEYKIILTGTVNNKTIRSNDDGSYEHKFSVKQDKVELVSEGKLIKCKDRSKRSQKMRNALYFIWENETEDKYKQMSFEQFYDFSMAILNYQLTEVWEIIKNNIKQ